MYDFEYSKRIVELTQKIERKLAFFEASSIKKLSPQLRKKNSIKTIQATVEIEGNALGFDEVTAIFDGTRVRGDKIEIIEVENAISLYQKLDKFNPNRKSDFFKAHKVLMTGLLKSAGEFRTKNVGVGNDKEIKYVAPDFKKVPSLVDGLFKFIKANQYDPLVMSALLHFKIEIIHPFIDGNGRMGRYWQSLYLYHHHNKLFEAMPVESVIRDRQKDYYRALQRSGAIKKSNHFVEYILEVIIETIDKLVTEANVDSYEKRIEVAKEKLKKTPFSKSDFQKLHPQISSATASRDLKRAVDEGTLSAQGQHNQTTYRVK